MANHNHGKKHRAPNNIKPKLKSNQAVPSSQSHSYTRLFVLLAVAGLAAALLYNHFQNKTAPDGSKIDDVKVTKQESHESKKESKPVDDEHITEMEEIRNFKSTTSSKFEVNPIRVDGRDIKPVNVFSGLGSSVRAYSFDHFLSDAECDGLLRAHIKHVSDYNKLSPIICFDSADTANKHIMNAGKDVSVSDSDFTQGTLCLNESLSEDFGGWIGRNWSYSTAFYPGENKFGQIFADRVFRSTGLKPSHGGKFQITSYAEGIGYKTHTDCTLGAVDKRDRFATILVYLRDVEEGGETEFPKLGVAVKPKKGQALVWTNMDSQGTCDPTSVHQAAKVIRGHKFILQRWYYFKNFYSIHRRPADADIPPRAASVAKVSCDEYEQGSCRWYDEWNYSHIKEYLRMQHSLL